MLHSYAKAQNGLMVFAEQLKKEVDRTGLALGDIRKALGGVPKETFSHWLRGDRKPPSYYQYLILKELKSLPTSAKIIMLPPEKD